ncbi:MAG: hypothetical protein HYY68_09195 [Thaumarchaeota archaeon]|nr:hypothetical protein [Nitrososphaerota archaeon]
MDGHSGWRFLELERTDIRGHHIDQLNENLIQDLLIHWATYAALLPYDGKREVPHGVNGVDDR